MTKRKLFLLLLIFVIYELGVWAGAIALAESVYLLVGFVLTVCGITLLLVYALFSRLSRPATTAAPQESAPSPAPAPIAAFDDQSEAVLSLIRQSNETLANSKRLAARKLNRALTDLPLYFLIGPAGGGKTSFFLASKLEPELLAGQDYLDSTVVSTRLANIWFAGESVVVEAAGGLFSGDAAVWSRFLAAFRRPVRKFPIFGAPTSNTCANLSGVVLCCDATGFVGVPDSARLGAFARQVQQRLRAVGEVFGSDFPVYVVFTNADAIPYFAEYFGRLPASEDQQPLGCSVAATPASGSGVYDVAETARISAALNKLYLSLTDSRLEFLARETDRSRKPGVYEFPREFKRIRGPLAQFLVDVFRPTPLQPNPRLQGFYFTGTRQVAASAASPANLDTTVVARIHDVTRLLRGEDLERLRIKAITEGKQEPEVTRWSFVSDLWWQITHAGQGAVPVYVDLKRQAYWKAAQIVLAAFCSLAGVLFINAFFQNRSLVHGIGIAAQECAPIPQGASPSLANLRKIEGLRASVEALTNSRPSLLSRFGFYEGDELKRPAERFYFTRFREHFLNGIVTALSGDLSSLPAEQTPSRPYETVYAALKTYRTITRSPAEASCLPDPTLVERLLGVWAQNRPPEVEAETIARANFQFFVDRLRAKRFPEELMIASKDDSVVAHARDYLSRFQVLEPQYRHIVEQVNEEIGHPARLEDLTHDTRYRAVLRVQEEMPAAFTRAGWVRVLKQIGDASGGQGREGCVLGSGTGRLAGLLTGNNSKDQLRNMYVQDYIQHWQQFLSKANVVPSTGCGDAAEKLKAFEANTSPILAMMALAARDTTFAKHTAGLSQQVNQAVEAKANGILSRIKRVTGQKPSVPALVAGDTSPINEDDITKTFQPVHAVFQASPPNPEHWNDDRNTPYLDALSGLRRGMEALSVGGKCSSEPGANSRADDESRKAEAAVEQLARKFDITGVDGSVRTLLEAPIKDARRLIKNRDDLVAGAINSAQQDLCRAFTPLKSKYPFNRRTEDDADPNAVAKIFAPQDSKFAVLKQALGDNVTNSGGSWTEKPDSPVKFSQPFLEFLSRASAISGVLFQGASPGMRYKLTVLPNAAVRQVTGPFDGAGFSMAEKEYSWRPPAGKIDLRVIQSDGGNSALRGFSGPWGIFRLLSGADKITGHQFYLIYLQGAGGNPQPILPDGTPIILEVTQFPSGVENAFDAGFFQVSCPGRATE